MFPEKDGRIEQWKKSHKHLNAMRKFNNNSLRQMANSFDMDEFDDLYEQEVVRESKELRKGKDPNYGFKKDTEGSF